MLKKMLLWYWERYEIFTQAKPFFYFVQRRKLRPKTHGRAVPRFSADFKDFEAYTKKAKDIEHQADQKTHEIADTLNKTFITPFDREDIYLLASELDDIVDLIENVIQDVYLFNIKNKIPALELLLP